MVFIEQKPLPDHELVRHAIVVLGRNVLFIPPLLAAIMKGPREGLGFALSARLAAAGHPVLMLARSNELLSLFSRKIKETGGVAHWRNDRPA